MTNTTTINVSVRVDETRKAKLEALAHDYGHCSQSAVIREYISEHYHQIFGNIDPEALADGRISEADKRQLINGAAPEAVVDEALLTDDADAETPTSDGGTTVSPESYTMTHGPQELSQSGPELTWDRLRTAVSDDHHWSDDLEIHPDRVAPDELKSSHKYATRIVVGILRHKATAHDLVPASTVEEVVDTYLVGLHDRADHHAGRTYIHETYRPLIEAELYDSPSPAADAYFTTEAAQIQAAETVLESGLELPDYTDTGAAVLDIERWHHARDVDEPTTESLNSWVDDVATVLESVAAMKSVAIVAPLEQLSTPYPDQYTDLGAYLQSLWNGWCQSYLTEVAGRHHEEIRRRISKPAVDLLAPHGL